MRKSQNLMLRAGIVFTALAVSIVWLAGCGDPRTEPLQPSEQGHTETIVLWENAESDGQVISSSFLVADTLAPITNPSEDTPARLTVVARVRPDCQTMRYEEIVNESIPTISDDRILPALISIDSVKQTLDSLGKARLDSVERIQRLYVNFAGWYVNQDACTTNVFQGISCDTSLCTFVWDGNPGFPALWLARRDSILNLLPASLRVFEDEVVEARIDTTILGFERDHLARIVDNRYTLALWLDDNTAEPSYPEAVFTFSGWLTGQAIYLAATHATVEDPLGYKERGFQLDLNQFEAADPNNPGYTREINWTTCFPGSERPCLQPGMTHTLYGRVTGPDSRISASLVLVYERPTP